jgi:hypothetical protein
MSSAVKKSELVTPQDASAAYKLMPKALREVADKAKQYMAKINAGSIKAIYLVGKEIAEVLEAEASKDTSVYGERPAELLAANLETNTTKLYQIRNFAEAFKRSYVDEIVDNPKSKLTLEHWLVISQLKDPAEREKMINRCLKSGMSCNELKLYLKGDSGKTNSRSSSGRLQKIPSTPIAAVKKLSGLYQQLGNYEDQALSFLISGFKDIPPADLDIDKTIEAYDAALDQMDKATTRFEKVRNGLSKARSELDRRSRNAKGDDEVFDEVDQVEDDETPPAKSLKKKKKKKVTA